MKILLLGKTGQLGWELERALSPLGRVVALDYPEIDMTNRESISRAIRTASPQIIINATAYTAVDRAENEREIAFAINGSGPGILAEEAKRLHSALIHYSTDYVFDGDKGSPYVESDAPHPLGVYGKSKLAGEQSIQAVGGNFLIFRTAWVFSTRRDSFVGKVLQWSRQQPTLKVVDDQVSNPTWARSLAEITALVIARGGAHPVSWLGERANLYHLAGDGYASRLEWARAILGLDPQPTEQITSELVPARTVDFPTLAQRPLFSALDCSKFFQTFGLRLPAWQDALRLAMQNN